MNSRSFSRAPERRTTWKRGLRRFIDAETGRRIWKREPIKRILGEQLTFEGDIDILVLIRKEKIDYTSRRQLFHGERLRKARKPPKDLLY